jgi:tetratricopeptide (TPR) repeat protein
MKLKRLSAALALTLITFGANARAQVRASSDTLLAPSLVATTHAMSEAPGEAPRRLLADNRGTDTRAARPRRAEAVLAQSGDARSRARARFEDGLRLANDLQWAQAAQAFEESYQLFPRPNTLFNLGLAHRALGQYTRAISELERFLQEGTPSPDQRVEVANALEQMRGRLARLTVAPSVEGARVSIDGNPADANTEVTVDPGNHVVEVTAPGHARYARTLTLRQSETLRHEARLERSGGVSTGAVVGIVAGVVAAGVLTGILWWRLSGEEDPYCGTLNQCIMPQ